MMFDNILLPLDGSTLAERVLPHAASLARAFKSKLILMRVVYQQNKRNQQDMINPIDWQMRKSEAEAYLDSVLDRLEQNGFDCEGVVSEGHPAEQIIAVAREKGVDLIIMASHGRSGPSAWNINSTVQKVLLRALMPVMIIRAYQEEQTDFEDFAYKRLIVPMDGSKRAECILPLAKSICEMQDSKVFLTHIVEEPKLPRQIPASKEIENMAEKLSNLNMKEMQKYFNGISKQFPKENVDLIIESSRDPIVALHNIIDREKMDLVLLSAHGYSGENRWPYGSIALNFIVYGTAPLIIIQDLKREEFSKTPAEIYAEQSKGH